MKNLFLFAFFIFLVSSCGENKNQQAATYGKLNFGAEEGLQYIVESETSLFNYFYNNARLTPEFHGETQLIEDFINNKYPLVVTYRDFTPKEKSLLKERKVIPYSTIIGLEGLALVCHPHNPDTLIHLEQLKNLLTGKGDSVSDLQKKWKNIVFDGKGSATLRYVDSLIGGKKLSDFCFSKESPAACLDFVSQNKDALGLVSFGLLADKDDKRVKEARKKIKIMGVSGNGKEYFTPSQKTFFNFDYPLIRKIYMHCRDAEGSLAMGFISYVSSEEGQLAIKQGGLMPARLAWNDVNVVFKPMKTQ